MTVATPAGYYDRFNPATKPWYRVLFKDGRSAQSAEMNEIQTMREYQFQLLAEKLFKDGTFISGGVISYVLDDTDFVVSFTAGQIYALGFVHNVPLGSVTLTGTGTEKIYLKLTSVVITESDDSSLLDPAQGAEGFGEKGAHRMSFDYEYVLNDNTGIEIATFQDGQLVLPPSNKNTIIQEILDIMAVREYEKDGSFQTAPPKINVFDFAAKEGSPKNLGLEIIGGIGRIKGRRRINAAGSTVISVKRPLSGADRYNEPEPFLTGTKVYNLDNQPVNAITSVSAVLQTGSEDFVRGQTGGGLDAIDSEWQPVESIVSVSQSPHGAYTPATDFNLSGNYIDWSPGGDEPSAGTTYQVVLRYQKTLTKAVRTETYISNETGTVSSAANTLAHTDVKDIVEVYNTATPSTKYVEGVDFTIAKHTGVMTWGVDPGEGTGITIKYNYWAHTVEGDYVGRDSFISSNGDQIFNGLPTKTPTGVTVDYEKQISFDVVGGRTPVDSTNILVTYKHTLARTDILVQRENGLYGILEGIPSVSPKLPSIPEDVLPIVQIHLPAEAEAADVYLESYDNMTLTVSELRALQNTVDNILYNQAQFQLYLNALNQPTATDKRGVFADNFATLDKTDISNGSHAASIDFLSRSIALPRTSVTAQPALSSSDASTKEGGWFPTYTEQNIISQPFSSNYQIINAYDSVNLRAEISLDRNVDSYVDQDTALIRTVHDDTNVSCAWVWNYYLVSNLTSRTSLSNKLGEARIANIQNNPWNWSHVQIESEWTDVLTDAEKDITLNKIDTPVDATVLTSNRWATVMQASEVVVKGNIATGTIDVTGSKFTPNEAAIQCYFGDQLVTLTATGSTVQETDTLFPGSVRADSSGNFTAQFDIPAGTESGRYQVKVIGRSSADHKAVRSLATTYYTATAYMEYYGLYLQIHDDNWEKWNYYAAVGALRDTLEIPINAGNYYAEQYAQYWEPYAYLDLYYTTFYSMGTTIATAIKEAVIAGVDGAIDEIQLAAAIAAMLAYTGLEAIVSADHINAIANAANLHTINVEANAAAMEAASDYAKLSLYSFPKYYYDPVGQTFTMPADRWVSSVGIYFGTAPSSSETVSLAICETDNGVPTNKYFATKTLSGSSVNTGGTETKFTFNSPIYLKGGVEYGIIVASADTAATVEIATLGQTDLNPANGLIVKNPSNGALFESPNASAWQLIPDSDLKFNLYAAKFTNESATLSTGLISLGSARSRFEFHTPFVELNDATQVTFQYSLDGTQWVDFNATKEVDLGKTTTSLYIRINIKGTHELMPIVYNDPQLVAFIFLSSGAHVCRTWSMADDEARYVDLWMDVDLPGGAAITPQVNLNAEGYNTMTEVTADAKQIDQTWWQRHWIYDTGGSLKQDVQLKINMTSAASYITPRARKLMCTAREG